MRGKGLLPSTPEKVSHRLGAEMHPNIGTALSSLRGSADLSKYLPERLDQGRTETCHAHSLAVGLYCAFGSLGKPITFTPSPLIIASTTYADVRSANTPLDQPLPVLQDTGAELQDDANAVARWGIGPIGPDVEGRRSDCPSTQEPNFPEPDVSGLLIAGSDLVGGEYSITIDGNTPAVIAASLDSGIPVWVGGLVGQSYENISSNDVAQPTPLDDTTAGGHAQLIVGYRTAGSSLEFLVVNSWGNYWGFNGTIWASSEWVSALWAAWPLTVKTS